MQVTPSRIFLSASGAIILGIAVGILIPFPNAVLLLVAALGIIIVAFGFPKNAEFGSGKWVFVGAGIALLAFSFGVWRGSGAAYSISYQNIMQLDDSRVRIEGTVEQYPDSRIEQTRYVLGRVAVNGDQLAEKVLVFASTTPHFSYGDRISVEGKLRIPEPFDGFNYPRFLAKDGIIATVRADDIARIEKQQNATFGFLLSKLRSALDRSTSVILPAQEAGILKALLVGDEGDMTEEFKEALNRVGLRHIVAVSGMNITIIVGIVAGLFLSIGLWRHHAFLATIALVVLFVLLIAAPASAVRAAFMGISARAGPLLGRRASSLRLLIASLAVMAFLSPLSLLYDLGFQLSFTAAVGMVLASEPISVFLKRWPLPGALREVLATTFAAQLFALPLLFLTFGRMSLVFPLTNVAVLPFLPFVTVWGWGATIVGVASPLLGAIAAFPLAPYFAFLAWTARFFAQAPNVELSIAGLLGWSTAVAWWAFLLLILWRYRRSILTPADQARALSQDFTG